MKSLALSFVIAIIVIVAVLLIFNIPFPTFNESKLLGFLAVVVTYVVAVRVLTLVIWLPFAVFWGIIGGLITGDSGIKFGTCFGVSIATFITTIIEIYSLMNVYQWLGFWPQLAFWSAFWIAIGTFLLSLPKTLENLSKVLKEES